MIAANSGADTSVYSALQKKSAEVVSQATDIAQFLERRLAATPRQGVGVSETGIVARLHGQGDVHRQRNSNPIGG